MSALTFSIILVLAAALGVSLSVNIFQYRAQQKRDAEDEAMGVRRYRIRF